MKKMKLLALLCALAPLAAFSVTPDQPASTNKASLDSLFGDTVIAKGKGVEVKRTDLDAAVVNNSGSSVRILFGNGSGGFGSPVVYTAGTTPWSVWMETTCPRAVRRLARPPFPAEQQRPGAVRQRVG